MRRILFIGCLVAVVSVFCSSLVMMAAEEGKGKTKGTEFKIKGDLIPHPETNDVKVLTENYESVNIAVTDKTKITATVKAKLKDIASEAELNLPKGTVTFELIDNKPVATGVVYTSKETWKMQPPKPKED